MAAAAVILLLSLLAGVGVIGSGGGLNQPYKTAWQPGRPFVVSSTGHTAMRHGAWRLVDALFTGTWRQNVYGPPPGLLSCSPDGTCYVLSAANPAANSVTPRSWTLYVSSNAGGTWSALRVPAGLAPSTALQCSGSRWCAVGGTYNGHPVLAVTRVGGHSFVVHPLPGGIGGLSTLSCPAANECLGLVATRTTRSMSAPVDATLLVTTDGGSSFHDEPVFPGDSMIDLACLSSTACTAVGVTDASSGTRPPVVVSAVTTNQGRTWRKGSLPLGFGIVPTPSGLSCPDARHCYVMGYLPVQVERPPQCSPAGGHVSPQPASSLPDMSPRAKALSQRESTIIQAEAAKQTTPDMVNCAATRTTGFSVIAKSSDGGLTWSLETPPADVPRPYLDGLTCPTSTECWASGQESVPVKVGGAGVDMASPVLIGTTNGGSTWSRVTFTTPATAPNATGQFYLSMGSVTCPSARVCLALGMAAQGAHYAPVYSLVVTGG